MSDPMRIRAQAQGDKTTVRVLVGHEMESGQRKDATGKIVPPWFIQEVSATWNGKTVISANGVRLCPKIRSCSSALKAVKWVKKLWSAGPTTMATSAATKLSSFKAPCVRYVPMAVTSHYWLWPPRRSLRQA